MTLSVLSLCSGNGGLDLAVCSVFAAEVRWHAETDKAASRVLECWWPNVPNLGDITRGGWDGIDADIIAAGWPCQPWSLAGKRKGSNDARAIWPAVARAVRMVRPRLVVLENVPAIVTAGELARVADDLAALGYDLAWTCLRAADAGAPHRRERVFILATDARGEAERLGPRLRAGGPSGLGRRRPDDDGASPTTADADGDGLALIGRREQLGRDADRRRGADRDGHAAEPAAAAHADDRANDGQRARAQPRTGSGVTADASGDGRHQGQPESARLIGRSDAAVAGGAAAADADGARSQGQGSRQSNRRGEPAERTAADADRSGGRRREHQPEREALDRAAAAGPSEGGIEWGAYDAAIRRWGAILGRPAPPPTEPNTRGGQRLSPLFVEWMMGLPIGHVAAVPGLTRNDKLRLLGNGVVPQQAQLALVTLLRMAEVAA